MEDARAISAQLVDIRNVGTHKVVKLTLHAPEEHAMMIMEMFGWPTGVNPVPVALARLSLAVPTAKEAPRPAQTGQAAPAGADKERRKFESMPAPQQAGILCNEIAFQRFLKERHRSIWSAAMSRISEDSADYGSDAAAEAVRLLCKVTSRAALRDNAEWSALVLAYRLWQRHPELEATA